MQGHFTLDKAGLLFNSFIFCWGDSLLKGWIRVVKSAFSPILLFSLPISISELEKQADGELTMAIFNNTTQSFDHNISVSSPLLTCVSETVIASVSRGEMTQSRQLSNKGKQVLR